MACVGAYPVQRINGVGSWSGIVSGIGDFFASSVGQAVVQVGTTIGTAYLADELFGGSGNSNTQQTQQQNVAPTSPSSPVQPSQYISQPPQSVIYQPAPSTDYTIPIILGVGMMAMVFMMSSKKR